MTRADVLAKVVDLLRREGWDHARPASGCFDLFARQQDGRDESLVLQVHENVDAADREAAREMKQACRFLGATPVIVGERTSRGDLQPHVLYERYDVPTIEPGTLRDYLALRRAPRVKHVRGGPRANLNREKFERKRREAGYSLNALAKEIGVSVQTVRRYRERGTASVEKAHRLEDVLGPVTADIELTDVEIRVTATGRNRVSDRLVTLGFEAAGFSAAPFDASAKDDTDRYVAKQEQDLTDALLAFLERLPEMADSRTFLVTEHEEDYGDLPSVPADRLDRMEAAGELKDELDR